MTRGRPSNYHPKVEPYLKKIEKWAAKAMTEEAMCEQLGVSVDAWIEYKKNFPELRDALEKGRTRTLEFVESAFYKRLHGYQYEEVIYERVFDNDAKKYKEVVKERRVKEREGNVGAQIFALKNLAPEKWKDSTETHITGTMEQKVANMTDEELKQHYENMKKKRGGK